MTAGKLSCGYLALPAALCILSCADHSTDKANDSQTASERIGVLRSTDLGATWQFRGYAEFNAPHLIPVDPSPVADSEGIALYFLDLACLGKPPGTPRIIYRAVTADGLLFSAPAIAFSYPNDMTDPYVLRMPSGVYRMYVQAADSGVISAVSDDGVTFTLEPGVRLAEGGTPGALVTPQQEIRLFYANPTGISSCLSNDGLAFLPEPNLRISIGSFSLVSDPHPIRLHGGGYLMSYISVPTGGTAPLDNEIRLAESAEGLNWAEESVPLCVGANPGLVETADGTLYIYFVDFHAFD